MSSIATPDPRLLPPDPRLPFPSTYSRDAAVEALESFYRSLPHIEPSPRRIRVLFGGEHIVDTTAAKLV